MNRERAISLAQDWVRSRYPVVPPIAIAYELTPEILEQIARLDCSEAEKQKAIDELGDWFIAFFCSWDTDELGVPEKLAVRVNHKSGVIERQS